jgi:hypothetical protein
LSNNNKGYDSAWGAALTSSTARCRLCIASSVPAAPLAAPPSGRGRFRWSGGCGGLGGGGGMLRSVCAATSWRVLQRASHTLLWSTGVDLSAGAASASRSQPSAELSQTSLRYKRRRKVANIVTFGLGERSRVPLRDARRFSLDTVAPVPRATRTTLGFGICPSSKDHSLSRRANP